MGYSISIKFKNELQKENAVRFMKENKEILNKIVSLPFFGTQLPYFDIENFSKDEDIPYGPKGKNLIGWKERGIPQGLYAIVVWISHKNEKNFYYYDDKKFKFFVKDEYDNTLRETQVNSQGFLFKEEIIPEKGMFQKFLEYLIKEERHYENLMEYMNILENKWTEENKPQVKSNNKR